MDRRSLGRLYVLVQSRQENYQTNQCPIKDIDRDPFDGIGKPEPLKYNYSGFWSRRIDEVNRVVYKVEDGNVYIISCRYHYE